MFAAFPSTYPIPIVYDLETTGLSIETDSVIQIAAKVSPEWVSLFPSGTITQPEFKETLIKPECAISASAMQVSHISEEMVKSADSFKSVVTSFKQWVEQVQKQTERKSVLLIAHNNFRFDRQMLLNQCKRVGIDNLFDASVRYGDTLIVFNKCFHVPYGERGLLKIATKMFGESNVSQSHNAGADVDLLIQVMHKCANPVLMYHALFEYSQS